MLEEKEIDTFFAWDDLVDQLVANTRKSKYVKKMRKKLLKEKSHQINANKNYRNTAPIFNIVIDEPNFHKKWYSLNGGQNITFTTETQINQTEWDKHGNVTVLIIFYANDTVGNENLTQVMVRKDIYQPEIIIMSPHQDDLFNDTAPLFYVEITDPNLHKMWYTIDDGFTNKTFDANETINQGLWNATADGIVVLTFFANDTGGNINSSTVNIIKDTEIPSIEIISPSLSNIFGKVSPTFNISITEANLISTRYTIDGGVTNTTFDELTGIINQTLWWNAPLGLITIRFYAEDIAGNVGYKDVIIIKDIIDLLSLKIINQSFSTQAFSITFLIHNEIGFGISNAVIQMWWNANNVSADLKNLGDGYYFISLIPIIVLLGENPILLNMTISALGYENLYFETFLSIEPDEIEKIIIEPCEIIAFLHVEIFDYLYSVDFFRV